MDDEIEELKELVRRNIALAEDTNRTVHKLRRSAAWGRFFQVVWWVAIIAISGATYYLYLQPYVGRIEELYGQFSSGSQQVQDFVKHFGSQAPASSTP